MNNPYGQKHHCDDPSHCKSIGGCYEEILKDRKQRFQDPLQRVTIPATSNGEIGIVLTMIAFGGSLGLMVIWRFAELVIQMIAQIKS